MDFKTTTAGSATTATADALLVIVASAEAAAALDSPLADEFARALREGDLETKPGQVLYAHRLAGVKAARVAFVFAGAATVRAFRRALAAGLGALKGGGARTLAVCTAGFGSLDARHGETLAVVAAESTYVYRETKPSAPASSRLKTISVLCADRGEAGAVAAGLRIGEAMAEGMTLAREWANRPGNHCTPTHLAQQAMALARSHGLKVDVLERKDCEKLGMGSFLAVAQGSAQPPKFIVMRWMGGAKADAPLVLVGKGITFDTGGISLKPAAEMDEMKFDMGGAASVLGTMAAVARLKAKVNLVGIVVATENMPGGRAVKPGDVVTSMSGQTIEILNTDAEGRLILCDALTYAERFKPAAVVDIATLTGACVIALGHHRSGLFSPDDALADELLAAGDAAFDPAWRLPLDDEYDEALKSHFADMGNVGGRAGGAVTAAMFLKRFAGKLRWAHLDIAGTAWRSGAAKGATGRPVPLLTHFVLGRAR